MLLIIYLLLMELIDLDVESDALIRIGIDRDGKMVRLVSIVGIAGFTGIAGVYADDVLCCCF